MATRHRVGTDASYELSKQLTSRTRKTREAAVREALAAPTRHAPPVFYALANALAQEPGREYDAVFWYHVGRLRAVYDALRCRDRSVGAKILPGLGGNLNKRMRDLQAGDPMRVLAIARKAIQWDAENPRDYDQLWVLLHLKAPKKGARAPKSASDLMFPVSEWPDILRYVHETHLRSVELFVLAKKQEAG